MAQSGNSRRRKTAKNVKQEEQQQSSSSSRSTYSVNSTGKRRKILLLIGLLCLLIVAYYIYQSKWERQVDTRPISQILQEQVDQCETLFTLEVQLENALAEDPFLEIIKSSIRPALETVASVRTQTAQYEAMERIPGGPVTFIDWATKQLDEVEQNVIKRLKGEEEKIIKRKNNEIKVMLHHYEIYHKESLDSALATVTPLGNEGILLVPYRITEEEVTDLASKISFQELVDKLSKLSKLYKKLEEMEDALKLEKTDLHDDPSTAESSVSHLPELIDEVESEIYDEIEANSKVYKLMLHFRSTIMDKITGFEKRFLSYEIDKKLPYLALVEMLHEDIDITRERLLDLRLGK